MADENLALYVGTYADADTAQSDLDQLKSMDDLAIVGSIVASRDEDGQVTVSESGGGEVAGGALLGGGVGLVVGLFAPPLLLSAGIGAAAGALVGELTKKHEEKKMGADLEEYLPPGSSAVVVVLDDTYLDGVDAALSNADKKMSKAIDSGDYEKIQKAIEESADDVSDAVDG